MRDQRCYRLFPCSVLPLNSAVKILGISRTHSHWHCSCHIFPSKQLHEAKISFRVSIKQHIVINWIKKQKIFEKYKTIPTFSYCFWKMSLHRNIFLLNAIFYNFIHEYYIYTISTFPSSHQAVVTFPPSIITIHFGIHYLLLYN